MGPPARLVLDGREHGGRLTCVGVDCRCAMPTLTVDRSEISDREVTAARMGKAFGKFKHRTSQLGVRLATTPVEQLAFKVAKQRSTHTGKASPRHQSRNPFAANMDAFGRKLGMNAWRAVAAPRGFMRDTDLCNQRSVRRRAPRGPQLHSRMIAIFKFGDLSALRELCVECGVLRTVPGLSNNQRPHLCKRLTDSAVEFVPQPQRNAARMCMKSLGLGQRDRRRPYLRQAIGISRNPRRALQEVEHRQP